MISANREVIRNASMCPGGEFDGTVYLTRNGTTVPAGRVTVEVVDGRNRVVNSTATEYDGFYVIARYRWSSTASAFSRQQMSELNMRTDEEPAF